MNGDRVSYEPVPPPCLLVLARLARRAAEQRAPELQPAGAARAVVVALVPGRAGLAHERRQLLRGEPGIERRQLPRQHRRELGLALLQLGVEHGRERDLPVRRPAVVTVHLAVEVAQLLAQLLLAGQPAALLGRDERAAERLEPRSEEHTSELQSQFHLVCRLLLEKKK